jgi:hypothetical protein
MNTLAYDLKNLALGTGEGSFTTRMQRHRGLQLIARELRAMGYELAGAGSLKPKHIAALVGSWKGAGLSAGTLKNRMGWIRWWGQKVRKSSVLPKDNAEAGIDRRTTFKGQRAHTTTGAALVSLAARHALAVKLQMAFGLRLEESLKLRPSMADRGNTLLIHPSWAKGGRRREIPIQHPRQRALLNEVRRLAGQGSLVPEGQTYIAARKELERSTWAAGIRNMHGHRHWYAQWRYRALTGALAPAAGGRTYENMNRAERAADYRARLIVSRELGHNRIEITDAYLGRRWAGRGAS